MKYTGEERNWNEHVQNVDLGLALGAEYDIDSGRGVTTLEVRYVFGLLDVFEASAPQQDVTGDLKNRALQISVGWYVAFF